MVFVLHGDPTNCELGLKGPGVITAQLRHGDLRYYGYGRKITLQPGEVHSVPIKKLEVGLDARPPRMRHYWTEPGEIEVSARFSTSIDSKHVPLFVEPVKLTVRDK